MTPEKLMQSRVNSAFLVLTLTVAVQSVISFPTVIFTILGDVGVPMDPYYTEFVIPQLLYPILTCIMAILALRILRIPLKKVAPVKPVRGDFIPWLGLFLGCATVMNYFVNGMMWFLDLVGIRIPDVFASYEPQTPLQAVFFFLAIAILPSVCEEILCRASVTGVLQYFHPLTAILVSAFAFGLMHATLQQIPFAFVLGLVFGFVYVKTGNILYPILFHFANNGWACVLTFLSVWKGENVASFVSYGADAVFVIYGVLSLIWLLRNKKFSLSEIPHSLNGASAAKAVIKAPFFWVFTGLYLSLTASTLLLMIGGEALGISF